MKNKKIKRKRWSVADKEYLKKSYSDTDIEVIAKHLGRKVSVIHQEAYRLGVTGTRYSINHKSTKVDTTPNAKPNAKPKANKDLTPKKEKSRNPNRWDRRKMVVQSFNADGKKLIRIDKKTAVYVSINATEQEIESIVNRYKRSA